MGGSCIRRRRHSADSLEHDTIIERIIMLIGYMRVSSESDRQTGSVAKNN